jgi:hypothetical protein
LAFGKEPDSGSDMRGREDEGEATDLRGRGKMRAVDLREKEGEKR